MSDDYNTATEADSGRGGPAGHLAAPITTTLPLTALVESLLFVADGPVTMAQLAAALDVSARNIEHSLDELEAVYVERGLRIQRDKSGVQLTTAPQAAEAVEKFLGLESIQRLSRPAVETLAIIAYQQPVTRPYIESIRGVNCDGVIKSLLTKGLIEESGRTEGPGRPVLYSTTSTFLQHFGLASLTELPPLDIESLLAAARMSEQPQAVTSEASESAIPAGTATSETSQAPGSIQSEAELTGTEAMVLDEAESAGAQFEDAIEEEIALDVAPTVHTLASPSFEEEGDSVSATNLAVEAEAEKVGAEAEDVLAVEPDSVTAAESGVTSAAGEPVMLGTDTDLPDRESEPAPMSEAPSDDDEDEDWDEDDEDDEDEDDDWEDEDGDDDAD